MGTVHQRDGFGNVLSVLAVGDGVFAVGLLCNVQRPAAHIRREGLAADDGLAGEGGARLDRLRLVRRRGPQIAYICGNHVRGDVPGGVGSAAGEGAAAEAGPGGDVQGVPGGNVVGPGENHVPIDRPRAFFKEDASIAIKIAHKVVHIAKVHHAAVDGDTHIGTATAPYATITRNSASVDHKLSRN